MTLSSTAAAVPLPRHLAASGPAEGRPVLLCHAGGQVFGLAAEAVLEVLPATAPAPLPGMAPPLLGLVAARGTVVPVFDLAAALGAADGTPPTAAPASGPGVPVHLLLRDGARLAVARVDAVGDLVVLSGGAARAAEAPGEAATRALRGETWHDGQRVQLIASSALLRAPATQLVPEPG
jgi:chemotaxis signal transduction protein